MFTSLSAVQAAGVGAILTAGLSGTTTGYTQSVFGTYVPREIISGELIRTLSTNNALPDQVTFETEDDNVPETFWSQILISGVFAGGQKSLTYDRVADSFFYQASIGTRSRWQSFDAINPDGSELMVNGNVYTVIIL